MDALTVQDCTVMNADSTNSCSSSTTLLLTTTYYLNAIFLSTVPWPSIGEFPVEPRREWEHGMGE